MDRLQSIKIHFTEAQTVLDAFLSDENNFHKISQCVNVISDSFKSGGKILSCGNGGSHCDSMHFAEELTGRYKHNRPALPAISISDSSHITCVGNDYGYDFIFSRYVQAHGKPGDVLLGISTSGNSENVYQAMLEAKKIGMTIIGLTGKDGGKIKDLCDIEVRAPKSDFADRAQEIHIKVIHSIIDGIEQELGYSS